VSAGPEHGVAALRAVREEHRQRRADAGEVDGELAVVAIDSQGRVRSMPAVTQEAITRAVLSARAIVELDNRAAGAEADVRELSARVREHYERAQRTDIKLRSALNRCGRVEALHTEAVEVTLCGCPNAVTQLDDEEPDAEDHEDGCGRVWARQGVCRECAQPFPCRTARVLADARDVHPMPNVYVYPQESVQ